MGGMGSESPPGPAILVVDDEESVRFFVSRALARRGFRVDTAGGGLEALNRIREDFYDLVLTDIRMAELDGMALLRRIRDESPRSRVILMTAFGSVRNAVLAMREGAFDYITKPFEVREIVEAVERALAASGPGAAADRDAAPPDAEPELIGRSAAMEALRGTIRIVAGREGSVLITGESGTGKELVARLIHAGSSRREGPFQIFHCASVPESLVLPELFGVAKGAYTGAFSARSGVLQRADRGTLFLDDVGEIPPAVQPALLQAIERGTFTPVGDTVLRSVSIRVIAATHRDLAAMTEEGTFRRDLYFRLRVLPVPVPPLREREGDVPELVRVFLRRHGRADLVVSVDTLSALAAWSWPGNVRELMNVVERIATMVPEGPVTPEHLPEEIRGAVADASGASSVRLPLRAAVQRFEKAYIESLLAEARGNVSLASRLGGLSRSALHAKLVALGVDPASYRDES